MSKENSRSFMLRPFSHFPYLVDEDFWGFDTTNSSGLTLSEDDKNIFVEAHLPGLSSDDIDISFEKGVLVIKGSKKHEEKDEKKKFYKKASSSFFYKIAVPEQIEEGKEPDATYKDGVIKITFVKKKSNPSKKISIKK